MKRRATRAPPSTGTALDVRAPKVVYVSPIVATESGDLFVRIPSGPAADLVREHTANAQEVHRLLTDPDAKVTDLFAALGKAYGAARRDVDKVRKPR